MRSTLRCVSLLVMFIGAPLELGCVSDDPDAKSPPADEPEQTSSSTGTTPKSGMAMVRVVHASSDAPAVDVYAKGVGPLFQGLRYGDTSEYLEVPAGAYDIELRVSPSKESDPAVYSTGD